MGLVVEAWEVRLRDEETGRVVTRELKAGAEWPCNVEELVAPAGAKPTPTSPAAKPAEARPAAKPAEAKPAAKPAEDKPAAPKSTGPKSPLPKQPKAEKKPAKSKTRRDLTDPKVKGRFDGEVLRAVRGGARTVRAIGKRFKAEDEADLMPIVAALKRLVEAGKVVQAGTGSAATFTVPPSEAGAPKKARGAKATAAKAAAPEPPKPDVASPPAVKLEWTSSIIEGHTIRQSTFEGGIFQLTRRLSGQFQLSYEKGERFDVYGCGTQPDMEALAEKLATAGVPTPAVWVKSGGNIDACAKITRLEGQELEWRETVEKGSELCIAATSDGEFRMTRTEGGSFALLFYARGDDKADELGCGSREALEAQALDAMGQVAAPAVEESPAAPVTPSAPVAPAEASAGQDAEEPPSAEKDAGIMDAFERAMEKARGKR